MKEIDVEIAELREKYGDKFADVVSKEIESCLEKGRAYRVHILSEIVFLEILFVTQSYFIKYWIFPETDSVEERTLIGYRDAKRALEIMAELDSEK
ncbi:hypothetical protein D1B31_16115 [Neobacillus notoginsengisoli]|uniref:Uncharacterized protein n=1 Tax=Neobacillus notoginsengisoli TaxID=1578198 RepID=A0A417YR13_9BACI|nr:hypothetical protein [Neobacillus notoginsengisoli]RHW37292.1 hypothetical protein D1B31_16115 [Neobacillus notoginsengisoli]